MDAGREMDAEVAEKVMGWPSHVVGLALMWESDHAEDFENHGRAYWIAEIQAERADTQGGDGYLPEYSTDIAAAWQVVEKLSPTVLLGREDDGWNCEFECPPGSGHFGNAWRIETAPLAICRAALAAVGAEVAV